MAHSSISQGRSVRLGNAFGMLWAGQTVSLLGDQITLIALPLLAVTYFSASSLEVGLLGACLRLPYLVLGLPAGVWVDRIGLHRSMVSADVVRGFAVATIAVLAITGRGDFYLLSGLAVLAGIGAVFFQLSYQSYVPILLDEPDCWHAANTRLSLSESMSLLLGPAAGGAVVAMAAPSGALVVDSLTYTISVASLLAIGRSARGSRGFAQRRVLASETVWRSVTDGWRYVRRQPVLNCIMWTGAAYNLGSAMYDALVIIYVVHDLHLSAGKLGLAIGIGGIGFPIGSLLSRPATTRLGLGPSLIMAAVPSVAGLFAAGLADRADAAVLVAAGTFFVGIGQGCFAVNAITLRQLASSDAFRARATAVHRFTSWGMLPIGAVVGGGIAQAAGLRAAILTAAVLATTCAWPLLRSPLWITRTARDLQVAEQLLHLSDRDQATDRDGPPSGRTCDRPREPIRRNTCRDGLQQ